MASRHLVSTFLVVSFLLYTLALLTAPGSADSSQPAGSEKPKRPKINMTRFEEFYIKDNIEWNRTRKDDDMRPSYAVLHANVHCQSNYTEAKNFITSMITEEYWPNVYWKNGQDAVPTLYIFTSEKKYAHRHDVLNSTADEIKELLRGYGFNGTPYPKQEEDEEDTSNKKTEL